MDSYATFIPEFAVKAGATETDIYRPRITIEDMQVPLFGSITGRKSVIVAD